MTENQAPLFYFILALVNLGFSGTYLVMQIIHTTVNESTKPGIMLMALAFEQLINTGSVIVAAFDVNGATKVHAPRLSLFFGGT